MKKYFLTGLATLLPVALTIYVVILIVGFLTRPFVGIVMKFLPSIPSTGIFASETVIRGLTEIEILIALFIFTILLGVVARWFFIHSLLRLGEWIMCKIPIINKVYKTSKEIIQILFNSNKKTFEQVVMVHFPDNESYCLGLIARESPAVCHPKETVDMVAVFLPTTPNPMTGFLINTPRSQLIYLDMKSEEAIKYVVSCGVVMPGTKEES